MGESPVERPTKETLADQLENWRGGLERMVSCRLDERLRARIGASDIVQNACAEALRRIDEYDGSMPLLVWVRLLARQEVAVAHRRHLAAGARDARRERAVEARCDGSEVQSRGVIETFARGAGPATLAARDEASDRLTTALDRLDPQDREILVMRHFERLSNSEAAVELDLTEAAASKRHARALRRLAESLGGDLTVWLSAGR